MDSQNPEPVPTDGLPELAADAFPRHCADCGRTFATAAYFLRETGTFPPGRSGFRQAQDDDANVVVELFRSCSCGATLSARFDNRRDASTAGDERRRMFHELQEYLIAQDMQAQLARQEILNVLHGRESNLLSYLRSTIQP